MITPYKTKNQIYYKKGGKKIVVRDSMECQSCVSGRDDVNEKLDIADKKESACVVLALVSVVIVMCALYGTLKWALMQLDIQVAQWQFGLIVGLVWCVVIGVIIYFSMRKAKINNGK